MSDWMYSVFFGIFIMHVCAKPKLDSLNYLQVLSFLCFIQDNIIKIFAHLVNHEITFFVDNIGETFFGIFNILIKFFCLKSYWILIKKKKINK